MHLVAGYIRLLKTPKYHASYISPVHGCCGAVSAGFYGYIPLSQLSNQQPLETSRSRVAELKTPNHASYISSDHDRYGVVSPGFHGYLPLSQLCNQQPLQEGETSRSRVKLGGAADGDGGYRRPQLTRDHTPRTHT
eukprot:sb/3474623/